MVGGIKIIKSDTQRFTLQLPRPEATPSRKSRIMLRGGAPQALVSTVGTYLNITPGEVLLPRGDSTIRTILHPSSSLPPKKVFKNSIFSNTRMVRKMRIEFDFDNGWRSYACWMGRCILPWNESVVSSSSHHFISVLSCGRDA